MPRMLENFFAQMFIFAQDYGINAKGSFTVTLKTEVDCYGEVAVDLKPAVKLPDPPMAEGKARMFMHADGTLITHQQHEMPLFKDLKKRDQKLRDPGTRKPKD